MRRNTNDRNKYKTPEEYEERKHDCKLRIAATTEPCNFRRRISLQTSTSSVSGGGSEATDGTAVATWWNVGGSLARGETVGLLRCSLHYCPNVRPRAVSEVLTAMYTVWVSSVAILTCTLHGLTCWRHSANLFTTVNKFSPNHSLTHTTRKSG